jgi:pSer/pThr/pTyr-binding forkhead associated (FHA) protein
LALRFRIRPPGGDAGAVERTVDAEPSNGAITLGRRSGCTIELPFGAVSGSHALITSLATGWQIQDLNSANGTFVDQGQRRLGAGEPHPLHPGEQVRLADVWIVFEGQATAGGAPAESTATLARRLVSDFFGRSGAAEVARVVVERGPDAGRNLPLTVVGQTYRVGRSPSCDLVMLDEALAREHAAFERHWNGVEVRDLGSRTGIEIDGERAEGWRRLYDGGVVTMGGTRMRLDDPEDRYLRQMQVEGDAASSHLTPPTMAASASSLDSLPPARPDRMVTLPRNRGPLMVAVVAAVVLAGVMGCAVWFLIGA